MSKKYSSSPVELRSSLVPFGLRSEGFSSIRRIFTMNRIVFIIDGFNIYHSVIDASRDLGGVSTKWLDLYSLCKSYLPNIGKDATLQKVYYFSALAEHFRSTDPDKIKRHVDYIKCLRSTGVVDKLSRFKEKRITCNVCHRKSIRHEEKETDVAIAVKLIESFFLDECDTAVLVTGDTDIAPAVTHATRLFPNKKVLCVFPYKRKNDDLARLVHNSFKIKAKKYIQHQFPDPVVLPDGTHIQKPATW